MTTQQMRRRQPSTGQKKKINTLADPIFVFYTLKSIPCTNFHVCVTLFTCMLHTWL